MHHKVRPSTPPVQLWRRLGRVSLDEAIGLILENRTRYGRSVRSQAPRFVAERSAANMAVLRKYLVRLQEKEKALLAKPTKATSSRILQLQRQREILNAMKQYGSRRLHGTELAAALVLAHGLEEKTLRPYFNAALSLERSPNPPFDGNVNFALRTLPGNALKTFYERLSATPERRFTALDFPANNPEAHFGIVTLLDLAGLVHKLPIARRFSWMHASGTPPEPVWNLNYNILKILANSPSGLKRQELLLMLKNSGIIQVERKANGVLHANSFSEAFANLQEDGLVRVVDKTAKNPRLRASPNAVRLIWRTQRTGVLHSDLHKILLGIAEPRAPVSKSRLTVILKELKLRITAESMPGAGYKKVLHAAGIDMAGQTAFSHLHGVSTLSHFRKPSLRKLVDYLAATGHTQEADFIRDRHL